MPKTKFYEHATISTAIREKFVGEVQRITWAYKLADDTVHLPGSGEVSEIQVFTIDAKSDDISDDVLAAVDKAISFPIIFEITRMNAQDQETRMVASHKELGASIPRLSAYFTTAWVKSEISRVPLPPSIDLAGLYLGLLVAIAPFALRPGEDISAATSRMDQAGKVRRQIISLEKSLRNETQLNRKIELRRQLLDREALLATLTADE